MPEARRINHPGPPAVQRCDAIPCHATQKTVMLRAGLPLLDAMVEAVDGAAAWFDLSGVDADTLSFVRPAPAPGDGHVAWYSATVTLEHARIVQAGAHLGRRDRAPFAHIHGVWSDQAGNLCAGHLLSEVTVLGRDVQVDVLVLDGARMESVEDPETRFTLFRPISTADITHPNAVLATARPHEHIQEIIATIAQECGLDRATVKGIGSLVGTQFADGTGIESYATEVLLTQGSVSDAGVDLNAVSVGFDGPQAQGRLARSKNTVCVTFELVLVRE
ncbi:hypothetical protein [Puniceibacterium sp. IMCC21224]|uniref:hypothetical protein n=1 Tax=Puniceibacterium sp. IMCC21224 TaxID=1618204 RepID=UPI00064E07D5|nr:hypothetical protein [Puniceibacterium sp. IMCC21224]KMK64821.1 hypothetical protein IMCC21224_1265 [Puniceibacterium sp. IMCC21224]